MAQFNQVVISNNPEGIVTSLGIGATNAVVIQNMSPDLSVVIGVGTTTPDIGRDAAFSQTASLGGWVLKPGETSPKINLTAGQGVYAALPEADSTTDLGIVTAKLQVYADFP